MQPYIKKHGVSRLQFKYFNDQAVQWYDPLKSYTKLEYDWVVDNINLNAKVVFDVGAHHGNYAVVFKGAKSIVCFDMEAEFENYISSNLKLNKIANYEIHIATLSDKLVASSLTDLKPDIYKIDIEGSEFQVLPLELELNPQVTYWIIEIHPRDGIDNLIKLFINKEYKILKVDRENLVVRDYIIGEPWKSHATVIAIAKGSY